MGACDHPTTCRPESRGRFGSTLCYPDSRVIGCQILAAQSDEVDHVRSREVRYRFSMSKTFKSAIFSMRTRVLL